MSDRNKFWSENWSQVRSIKPERLDNYRVRSITAKLCAKYASYTTWLHLLRFITPSETKCSTFSVDPTKFPLEHLMWMERYYESKYRANLLSAKFFCSNDDLRRRICIKCVSMDVTLAVVPASTTYDFFYSIQEGLRQRNWALRIVGNSVQNCLDNYAVDHLSQNSDILANLVGQHQNAQRSNHIFLDCQPVRGPLNSDEHLASKPISLPSNKKIWRES